MKKILLICIALPAVCVASGDYTPTTGYIVKEIEGWRVLVNKELLSDHADLAEDVLKLLNHQLYQITRIVPDQALKEIRKVPIWVEYNAPRHRCMCYHPSEQWLRNNGFNPDKASSVEIANSENFLKWTLGQPWMVMHELAHSYHNKAVDSKKYESVQHISGKSRRAYALNNDQEYFAECTEAFLGTNDFYPFVRSELKQHDRQMYELLRKLWIIE